MFLTRKIAQNGVCDVFTFFCHKTLYYRYFFSISKLRGKSVKTSQKAFKPTLTRRYTCYVFVLKTSHCDTFLSHFFVFVQIVRQTILKTLNFFALFCTFVTFFCTLLRFRFKSVTTFKISKIEKKSPCKFYKSPFLSLGLWVPTAGRCQRQLEFEAFPYRVKDVVPWFY